jgi:hypothetical protein
MSERSSNLEGPDSEPTGRQRSSRWFYVQHGEMYGPVSSADLRAAAHLGFVGPDDLVRRSDRTDWMPARSVRGLFKPPE